MPKFFKSVICLALIFLLLAQPCLAFVNQPIPLVLPQLNRLSQIKDYANLSVAKYTYDPLSRRIKTELGNNTAVDYQYDLANQLRQLAHYKIPQPDHDFLSILRKTFSLKQAEAIEDVAVPLGTFSYFAYHYDQAGNRIDLRSNNQLTHYRYNNIYELTNTTGAQTHAYQYDNVGNRTTADGIPYASNNLNQYTQVGSNNFTYDGNGNLTSDGTHTYSYDAENRLITAIGGQNSSYEYDGFGRRISKTVGGLTTYYIYDGDQIIEERDTNNTLLSSYVYGEGIDEVLTMHRGPQKVFYHYDGLGSVTNLTDTSGNVVESYTYDVYGQPNQTSQIGNRFYFTGRELDEESGLYYYKARYYSPTIGRFLQRDPLTWGPDDQRLQSSINLQNSSLLFAGLFSRFGTLDINTELTKRQFLSLYNISSRSPQLLHPYIYVFNSPNNFVDPLGLWSISLELYSGLGGGIILGQNPGGGFFMTLRVGYGIGGGVGFDPLGTSPGWKSCDWHGYLMNSTLGGFAEAGVGLGPFSAGTGVNLGVRHENPGGYYLYRSISPKAGLDWGWKIRAGASIGGELSIY
ncbi:MAG: RHS repeat-associated core domain-containing protein [Candidatus Omnitrophota bacterium]|nr:RHS repeat-associated core domain-containing protein [Candidatus Omnitrophota bacterium]